MPEAREESLGDKAKEIAEVGGWVALAIAVLTAAGVDAALQAILTGFRGGYPELGLEGSLAILNVFVLTAPLAISVMIAGFLLARAPDDENFLPATLLYFAIAIATGLFLGNLVYQTFFGATISVNVQDLATTVNGVRGPWWAKVIAAIGWFLVGYYEWFGILHFAAAFFAGGFAAYVGHRLLPR